MPRITVLFIAVAIVVGTHRDVLAHPGHGTISSEKQSVMHYLVEAPHAYVIWAVVAMLAIATAKSVIVRRKRNRAISVVD